MTFQKNHVQLNSGRTYFKKGHIPWNKGKKGLQAGNGAGHWKGGEILHSGYWYIFKPNHLRANKQGYVKRSILVMEKKLGRKLLVNEIVHHIDRNTHNDDPHNLSLFKNHSEHQKHHYPKGSKFGINFNKFRKEG